MDAGRNHIADRHPRQVRFDRFELDPAAGRLSRDGTPLYLERRPIAMLTYLVSHPRRPVGAAELRHRVPALAHATDEEIDRAFGHLRTALGDHRGEPRCLEAVGPLRYCFVARLYRASRIGVAPDRRWLRPVAALGLIVLGALTVSGPIPEQRAAAPVAPGPAERAARAAYLTGRYLLEQTPGRLDESQRSFERALRADSQYAPAYVGLAAVAVERGTPNGAALRQADRALVEALRINDSLVEAYQILGTLRFLYYRDWAGAEAAFHRALALAPEDSRTLRAYALFLSHMGRHSEALDRVRAAALVDPVDAGLLVDAGMIRYYARDLTGAIEECGAAVELDPDYDGARLCLVLGYDRLGLYDRALEEAATLMPGHATRAADAVGNEAALLEWWREYAVRQTLESTRGRPRHYQVARAYARIGAADRALAWLERGAAEGVPGLLAARVDPMMDLIRAQPRYQAVLTLMESPRSTRRPPVTLAARTPITRPAVRQTASLGP